MDTSLSSVRQRYAKVLAPDGSFWKRDPSDQILVLKGFIEVLEAKPGDQGYDISSDADFTWTE
jgi:hypothetical protein